MLKRALSLGLITTTFLLAACGDDGSTTTSGAGGSGAAGGMGGSGGGMGGAGGSGGMGGSGGGMGGSGGGMGGSGGGMMASNPLDGMGPVEIAEGGFQFTEGPQWNPARNTLLFTDIPPDRIYEFTPGVGVNLFRDMSGNSNGLEYDTDGFLLACEHSGRRVSRTLADGTIVSVVEAYMGKKFNSPNDLVARKDGNIYFTDPPYGLADPGLSELGFFGVFRATPAGTAELIADDMSRPNGIALSPDQNTLYVVDTMTGELRTYPVGVDGTVGAKSTLATTSPGPDGMAVDDMGHLYIATSVGVEVYRPDGSVVGTIPVPEQPSNCAFGGEDRKTLYITARTTVYRVALQVTGIY